jgi:phosphonopyruvate decarboxylase
MIEAHQFVEAARDRGFRRYAGVPCSFLTPFINYVLQDPTLEYVSMANEGDAVALIAGVALAGPAPGEPGSTHRRGITLMQNSGLGNAVSPLTSLTWTFRLPQLLIVTWRGQPGVHDEPQHALMGPVTPAMLDLMEVPWELFPSDADGIGAALDRAIAHMDSIGRPYALLMQKGSVAPHPLRSAAVAGRVAAAAVSTGAASRCRRPRCRRARCRRARCRRARCRRTRRRRTRRRRTRRCAPPPPGRSRRALRDATLYSR